ncbi:MAG TPA: alpha-amylase family glycosyl hydrolase [Acidobacteriaceae bacterium]|nr:alpha-amylase family glycosyl hydrolase [Acidobacteriaceae bacterium]
MKRHYLAALLIACGGPWFAAAAQNPLPPCAASPAAAAPCVDKVDPPNWFAGLPSPMLLLHGEGLTGARFSVTGRGVSLAHLQISANGHYAFLWLVTASAAPQQLRIRVVTPQGSTAVPFSLARRTPAPHAGFSASDVMYLIMTDRFADGDPSNDPQPSERDLSRGWHGGDFRGIQQHLDYLQQLGVTTLWTTPVYDNDGGTQAYHGYSATDLYRTDPHFGSLADLRNLAEALHRRGMKLVLDTVPNHVGAAHPWALDPPTPDWFHGTREHHLIASDRFQTLIDPHATPDASRAVTQGWFANVLPDLKQENPLVRQYLIQNVVWWIESSGADGLRYDTFPYVGRAFWQSLNGELRTLYPRLTTVGEIFNSNPVITSFFAGGAAHDGIDTGLGTPFDFPTYFALRNALVPRNPATGTWPQHAGFNLLEDVLREDWLYPHPERLVVFFGNHDTMRFLSQPGATVPDLKLAFALLATLRGMPQIYSGDEIAMRGGNDPDNRHDFPGGFPGDPQDAFTAAGRTPEQADVHDWAASLFHFRLDHAVLATGLQQDLFVDPTAFVFTRAASLTEGCSTGSGEHIVVALNSSDQPRDLTVDLDSTALQGCSTFTPAIGSSATLRASGSELTLTVPAQQAIVFSAH